MRGAVLAHVARYSSDRLLSDLSALDYYLAKGRPPARVRLEEALGLEFADWLVAALTDDRERWYEELLARARMIATARADDEEDHRSG
jgi:hypothetical protein